MQTDPILSRSLTRFRIATVDILRHVDGGTLLLAIVATAATCLFYGEALVSGSVRAGFVYGGDFWHACLAHLAKASFLISRWTFSGIDFSTHGGASEFFLRPNLYPYHPMVVLYCIWRHPDTPQKLIRLSVFLLFAHSWLCCYFTSRLCVRYLKLGVGAAIFVALGYTFSVQMINALGYPPYLFCTSMLPWAIYAGISLSERISAGGIVRNSLPVFIMLTGGYVAIGVSCVVLSAVCIVAYLLATSEDRKISIRKLGTAASPFLLAGCVAAPLYWAILEFHSKTPTADSSLYWSAHMLADAPRTMLRLLSSRLPYPGPFAEFSLAWGLIPVAIIILFFAGIRDREELTVSEWRILKFCGVFYCLTALAIYGVYSPLSDLVYAIPGIGIMHIYQRHLLAGHFFFVIGVAIMLKAVIRRSPARPPKVLLFALAGITATSAHLLTINSPALATLKINDYIVFELMGATLFAASLFFPGEWFSFGAAAFFMFLSPLGHIYDHSRGHANYTAQLSKDLSTDKPNNDLVISYFRSHSRKEIIKYLDLTPGLMGYLSKNYPWFQARDVALASYGGYEFQLAARADYLRRMTTTLKPGATELAMQPDWRWVEQTGAEFVIFQEGYALNDPKLASFADLHDPSAVLRLPGKIVIAPLKYSLPGFGDTAVSGRYVRIQLSGKNWLSLAEVRIFGASGTSTNLAQGKRATQSSTHTLLKAAAERALDGNTNGVFSGGSVTHTNEDVNPWWEVDLGAPVTINSIEIWNRTDCCGDRLNDYWVFVSGKPFTASDSPDTLRQRSETQSTHLTSAPMPSMTLYGGRVAERHPSHPATLFENGYLRMTGTEASATARGFQTDGASEFNLDVDASKETKVQYLFWPNERLKFYLQGSAVASTIEDGLQTVVIPAGHQQHLQILYVNWPIRFFLLLYVVYFLAYVAALAEPALRVFLIPRLRRHAV